MSKLLLEDEEYGVKHVKELGDVEDVGHHQRPFGLRVFGVVNRLTGPAGREELGFTAHLGSHSREQAPKISQNIKLNGD